MQQDLEAVKEHRDRIIAMLDQPLDTRHVKSREGRGGRDFSYMATPYYIDKMNEIFGYDGWKDETVALQPLDAHNHVWKAIVNVSARIAGEWIHHSGEGFAVVQGRDPKPDDIETAMKGAASDGLKRACRKFGNQFGNSLYSDEAPITAENIEASGFAQRVNGAPAPARPQQSGQPSDTPACEKCGGPMWDNRAKKASGEYKETRPDFTCKDRDNCNHAVWLNSNRPQQNRFDSTQNQSNGRQRDPLYNAKPGPTEAQIADMERLAQLIWGESHKGWRNDLNDYTWEYAKARYKDLTPAQAAQVITALGESIGEEDDPFSDADKQRMESTAGVY